MRFSPVLASLANVFQIPIRPAVTATASASALQKSQRTLSSLPAQTSKISSLISKSRVSQTQQQCRAFSQATPRQARKQGKMNKPDRRVTMIRYHLHHPVTLLPRPLRFSRTRYLRHWTIHRAWNLFRAKVQKERTLELERQYNSMREACEELRVGAGDGGKLFRKSMIKKGLWKNGYVPVEYGRGTGGEWIGGLGVRLGEKKEGESGRVEGNVWDSTWTRS